MITPPKSIIRTQMKESLKLLDAAFIKDQSTVVCARVAAMPAFQRSSAVSLYIGMPQSEIDTGALIEAAFSTGKRVFIPKVTG